MFGRIQQMKIMEILAEWDELKARVLQLEIDKITDPLERIAARNSKGKLNGSSKSDQG